MRLDAFNDNSDEDSVLSHCSAKSKGSESSFQSKGSAASPRSRRGTSPLRSPSPRNRDLPPTIRLVQEEVRTYNPRAPAIQAAKAGRVGPVKASAKGAANLKVIRSSDTVHPRHVSLGDQNPSREGSAAQKRMKVKMRAKGKGQGKSKTSQKGRGKSKPKGRGKTKSKGVV